MIGQYTLEEINNMEGVITSSVSALIERGIIIRRRSVTLNYYKRESDDSWTNYYCRTVDRV